MKTGFSGERVKGGLGDPNFEKNLHRARRTLKKQAKFYLPFLAKTLEKVVSSQLQDHVKTYSLHDNFQSAYRPPHSTETAMLRITNDLLLAADDKLDVLYAWILAQCSIPFINISSCRNCHLNYINRSLQCIGLHRT